VLNFIALVLIALSNATVLAQAENDAPPTNQDLFPKDAPQSQSLVVDREEFLFELRDGVLTVKHYSKDAIGFAVATKDPTPVRSLSSIPNFLLTAIDSKTQKKYLIMIDIVSMTLSDQVRYTLGRDIDAAEIYVLAPQGEDLGLPAKIHLRDPNARFDGVRPPSFDKFRKIPVSVSNRKVAVPLLPADSIRALLFSKGSDVRMYYVDLNDANQDEDGFFLFRLEGKTLHISHYGARKLRFDSSSASYELSVPPHPFVFSLLSGGEVFHLDPADFSHRASTTFQLPNVYEALEIWSADPNTLASLFQATPSLVRNSVLSGENAPVGYRSSKSAAPNSMSESVLLSQTQTIDSSKGSFRYVNSNTNGGIKHYGEFRLTLTPDFRISVSHHRSDSTLFITDMNHAHASVNPDFGLRFTLMFDQDTEYVELKPSDFKDGKVLIETTRELSETTNLLAMTNNIDTNHPAFFEKLVIALRRSSISCVGVFAD
jgi:hypothetical protein